MEKYRKAVVSVLTGVVALVGVSTEVMSPEMIAALATVIGTILVYVVPNEE